MTLLRRILPQPWVSLAIAVLWMALAPSLSANNALLAALVALVIPWLTQGFWPDRPRLVRPVAGAMLFLRVLWDIIVANIEVARLVLGPIERLRPAFVEVPLAIEDPLVATILGSIVTLTPGTLSVDVDRERRLLLIHALDVPDEARLVATIKSRYEAPLKEIFGC